MYFAATTIGQQSLRLAELFVVRAYYYRHTIHRCLGHIVYAHAKTTAHIGHGGITVDARQQAIAVYYQAVGLGHTLRRGCRVAHIRPLQFALNLSQVVLAHHVGSQHQAQIGVGVEITDDDVLVGLPRTAGHEHPPTTGKALDKGQRFGRIAYVYDAVKTGVAHHRHLVYAYAGKQSFRSLVLHVKVRHAMQHTCIVAAVPTKEYLAGPENARHRINRHMVAVQYVDVVAPELIFYKVYSLGTRHFYKLYGVERSVEGQVTYHIGPSIVLAHLIARGREKGEQYFAFGVLAPQALHERAALFKLAQRGGMKPHIAAGAYLAAQYAPSVAVPAHHGTHLFVKECSYVAAEHHQVYCE